MAAARASLAWLSWILVVLVVISAVVTLLFSFDVFLADPDPADDFVDQLFFMRTEDERAFPFVLIGSLASLGVFLVGAALGLLLRAWAEPSPTRDGMTLLLVVGGVVGIAAQLLNIGVADAARPFLCDCGYRAEEMVGLARALTVGWSIVYWMLIGALTLVGLGVALAGRAVQVSGAWRTLSYAIAVGVLVAAVIRVAASLVFIEAFDPFLVSDLIVALVSGILVPAWAILASRGVDDGDVQPVVPATT